MQATDVMAGSSRSLRSKAGRAVADHLKAVDKPPPVSYTPELVAYVTAVAIAAAALSVKTFQVTDDPIGLLVLAAAVFLVAASSVRIMPGVTVGSNASTLINLGLAVTFGPIGAIVGAFAEATGGYLRLRSGWFRLTFNTSTFLLCNLGGWWAFTNVSSLPIDHPIALGLAGLAAGVTVIGVNTILVGTVVAVATRTSLLERVSSVVTGNWYSALYAWGVVPFPVVHEHAGALGVTWLLAPVAATQALLMVLASRVRAHNEQRFQLMARIQEESIRVERSYDATLVALTHALDARDRETEGHSRRVVEYTREIATRMGIQGDELTTLAHGALLHDIGKIGVPDAILHKPGQLTEEEWEIMRRHPQVGAAMVEDIEVLKEARMIILHHHERYDGLGYPKGLKGPQITLGARVFAVADTVDAMTQDRPYRLGVSMDQAREELRRFRGKQFDPDAVDSFLALPESRLIEIRALRTPVNVDLLAEHAERRDTYLAGAGLGVGTLRRQAD